MHKKQTGFTLIELVVTILIIALLTSMAVNYYQHQMIESRRTDAKTKLTEIMQREEKYFNENNTYTTNFLNIGYTSSPVQSDNLYYSVAGVADAAGLTDGIILTATPQGPQTADSLCLAFILNSNGQKSTSTGATTGCW